MLMRALLVVSVLLNLFFVSFHVMDFFVLSNHSRIREAAQNHIYYGATMSEIPVEVADHIKSVPEHRLEHYRTFVPPEIILSDGQLFVYENLHVICYMGAEKSGDEWIIRGTYWQST